MAKAIHVTSTFRALAEIRAAQARNESAHIEADSETLADSILHEIMVECDDYDYCEQAEAPTDIWGKMGGQNFRCHLSWVG
jgi:hypothetical protein